MGNIVGKPFGVVASKDYNTALTESVKEGNQAKFYLTENGGNGFNDITATTDDSRNTLIVNGNKIQGVSTSDINKLNLISGSGLITDGAFKYKGIVTDLEYLPTNANVGDVYVVNNTFKVNYINYPAYTSVVYVNDGTNTWQPLGGTMEIGSGTFPDIEPKSVSINYSNANNIPISSFTVYLDGDKGLYANNGKITLNLSSAQMNIKSEHQLNFTSPIGPMGEFDIYCGDAIKVLYIDSETTYDPVPALNLKLSSTITYNESYKYKDTRGSGLTINYDNGLCLALATTDIGEPYINNCLEVLPSTNRGGGGLAFNGNAILEHLNSINYVNSSINIGSGLYKDERSQSQIKINPGESLYINSENKLSLNVSNPLNISDNTLKLNIGSGLTINNNNELTVPVGEELEITNSNLIKLNANYLSGTVKDVNNFYYSLGGIYFPHTIKSGQKNDNITVGPSQTGLNKNYGLTLRCGTGLAFQEGYEDFGDNSSQILGHDGRYYVNIDNITIGLNTDSKLRVKHDSTLSESSNGLSVKVGNSLVTGDDGININLPIPIPSDLQQLPVSTAGILVNDDNNGLCVDIPALKRLVELIMAAK